VPPEPPEPDFLILPLNLRAQLGRFGIGSDDLIVIEGMPEDSALTAGAKKPDGSWGLRETDLDACFMPLYGNGETYTLRVCVLTPDPSDHGLAKTKGKAEIKVEVPLTPLPILEAFEDAVPAPAAIPASDTVIQLPADPKLKASAPVPPPAAATAPTPIPAPAPSPATATTAAVASSPTAQPSVAPAQPSLPKPDAARGTFDQQLAKLRTEWQAKVARQVAAAEERLKATHLAQLNRLQGAPPQDGGQRSAAPESAAKAELPASRTAPEQAAGLDPRVLEQRLADARKQWQAEHEAAVAQARETWRSEEAARLAAAEAAWREETVQQRLALEARMEESYKERLAAIEAALAAKSDAASPPAQDWSMKLEHALADAQVGWEADEADRRAKLEAELTAAHERRIAEVETQQAALYEMRLAAAEAAWQKAEAERLATTEAAWSAVEAERLAAVEARWRAEHDKKLEAVLASFGTMVKGQLGAIGNTPLLPAVEAAAPLAPQAQPISPPEAADSKADLGWRETAAA
jgi:hypothetical protein